jgi:hypothetical protein
LRIINTQLAVLYVIIKEWSFREKVHKPQILKRLLPKILTPWLACFKWYRKTLGGKWYKTIDKFGQTGFASPARTWSQKPPDEFDIVMEVEEYQ